MPISDSAFPLVLCMREPDFRYDEYKSKLPVAGWLNEKGTCHGTPVILMDCCHWFVNTSSPISTVRHLGS